MRPTTPTKLKPSPRDTRSPNSSRRQQPEIAETASSVSDSIYSAVSVTSSYRHHNAGPFMPSQKQEPQPVLVRDSHHKPKTLGSFGLLIVGLGGANGTTLLCGVLANRYDLEWRGPQGQFLTSNYYRCILSTLQKSRFLYVAMGSLVTMKQLNEAHRGCISHG